MLYSRFYLEQRILEEKFRSCRTGSPFSIVLFNPLELISQDVKDSKKAIKKIVKILDQETRETDIKGWWNNDTLAILLPDTLPEGAFRFTNKFFSTIKENCHPKVKLIDKFDFKIYTFPNTHTVKRNAKERSSNVSNNQCLEFNHPIDPEVWDLSTWNGLKRRQNIIKRILDIIFSVNGLILLSPVFLLCAVLIKLDSPGPIIYKQTRVGKSGTCFTFFKFRTMYHNCDESIHENHVKNLINQSSGLSFSERFNESSYKLIKDERITRFGSFLRKTSLDELPQLFNVLKGDMCLVGPRPHPVYEAELYNLWHSYRLDIKPGITGLGQVDGRYNIEYEEVYRLDLRYLKSASLLLDLKIILKTFLVVLSFRGAY